MGVMASVTDRSGSSGNQGMSRADRSPTSTPLPGASSTSTLVLCWLMISLASRRVAVRGTVKGCSTT